MLSGPLGDVSCSVLPWANSLQIFLDNAFLLFLTRAEGITHIPILWLLISLSCSPLVFMCLLKVSDLHAERGEQDLIFSEDDWKWSSHNDELRNDEAWRKISRANDGDCHLMAGCQHCSFLGRGCFTKYKWQTNYCALVSLPLDVPLRFFLSWSLY